MINEAAAKKMSELMKDEAFLEKLGQAENAEAVKVLFAENGVELTDNELNMILVSVPDGAELSTEDMDNVSGGGFFDMIINTTLGRSTWNDMCNTFRRYCRF